MLEACAQCRHLDTDEDGYEVCAAMPYFDEDEAARYHARSAAHCPYFEPGDEYTLVKKQN